MTELCPYCGTPCKKVGEVYLCPNHGRVLIDVDKEEKKEGSSYIG